MLDEAKASSCCLVGACPYTGYCALPPATRPGAIGEDPGCRETSNKGCGVGGHFERKGAGKASLEVEVLIDRDDRNIEKEILVRVGRPRAVDLSASHQLFHLVSHAQIRPRRITQN